jgi:hypothetical protein
VLVTASICIKLMYIIVAIVLPQYLVLQCMRFCACPVVAAGQAIRCLAGRHSSHSTPFLPTVGPLAGPARLSRVAIIYASFIEPLSMVLQYPIQSTRFRPINL